MGTKNNPGKFDCYANAEPDEPMFVLLGRDPSAHLLVALWALMRSAEGEDVAKLEEARDCSHALFRWADKRKGDERCRTTFRTFRHLIARLGAPIGHWVNDLDWARMLLSEPSSATERTATLRKDLEHDVTDAFDLAIDMCGANDPQYIKEDQDRLHNLREEVLDLLRAAETQHKTISAQMATTLRLNRELKTANAEIARLRAELENKP